MKFGSPKWQSLIDENSGRLILGIRTKNVINLNFDCWKLYKMVCGLSREIPSVDG